MDGFRLAIVDEAHGTAGDLGADNPPRLSTTSPTPSNTNSHHHARPPAEGFLLPGGVRRAHLRGPAPLHRRSGPPIPARRRRFCQAVAAFVDDLRVGSKRFRAGLREARGFAAYGRGLTGNPSAGLCFQHRRSGFRQLVDEACQ